MTYPTPVLPQSSLSRPDSQGHTAFDCQLNWRQGTLVGKPLQDRAKNQLVSLEDYNSVVACLTHSPVRLVYLDPNLGAKTLVCWAEACQQANKFVFLRLRSNCHLPQKLHPIQWRLKRFVEWVAAALLVIISLPVFLGILLLLLTDSPETVFVRQWCVGERGKLFQRLKFCTCLEDAPSQEQMLNRETGYQSKTYLMGLRHWLRQSKLDGLPQLFNVLGGEMSLIGPHPCAMDDIAKLPRDEHYRLRVLPGITGEWQKPHRSSLVDAVESDRSDLEYLYHWSLLRDIGSLMMMILSVFSRFSAH